MNNFRDAFAEDLDETFFARMNSRPNIRLMESL